MTIYNSKPNYIIREELDRRGEDTFANKTEDERNTARKALAAVIEVSDGQVIDDLLRLGFTAETVGAIAFIPLIEMAWADGTVSRNESHQIIRLLGKHGYEMGSPPYRLIETLLHQRPTDKFMEHCLFVLRNWYHALPADKATQAQANLLEFARVVADASGGFLGGLLGGSKVSSEEEELLAKLQAAFTHDSNALHNALTTPNGDDGDA